MSLLEAGSLISAYYRPLYSLQCTKDLALRQSFDILLLSKSLQSSIYLSPGLNARILMSGCQTVVWCSTHKSTLKPGFGYKATNRQFYNLACTKGLALSQCSDVDYCTNCTIFSAQGTWLQASVLMQGYNCTVFHAFTAGFFYIGLLSDSWTIFHASKT